MIRAGSSALGKFGKRRSNDCERHSIAETGMVCARCEQPVCAKCVVTSIVGTRCRTCAPVTGHRATRSASSIPLAEERLFGLQIPVPVRTLIVLAIFIAVAGVVGYAWLNGDRDRFIVRTVVIVGALFSMVIHEFSHGLVAYIGGDKSVKSRGFLTFNPLKFMDPVYSVAMPLLFVMMGGLPLMGGRTLIDHQNLRSKWWATAVSLAGPASNLLEAVILASLLRFEVIDPFSALGEGIAYLAVIEIMFAMFNMIPIPPLDGFGALASHLSHETQVKAQTFGRMGYFLLLAAMWTVPEAGNRIWAQAYDLAYTLGVSPWGAYVGWSLARLR